MNEEFPFIATYNLVVYRMGRPNACEHAIANIPNQKVIKGRVGWDGVNEVWVFWV